MNNAFAVISSGGAEGNVHVEREAAVGRKACDRAAYSNIIVKKQKEGLANTAS